MKFMRSLAAMAVLIWVMMVMAGPVLAQERSNLTPPKIVSLQPIALSTELQQKYSEQTVPVKVRINIAETGLLSGEVSILDSSGDEAFDKAVVESIQKSVFTPAYTPAHQPVACAIVLPLHIKVEKYVPEEPTIEEGAPSAGQ